MLISDPNTSRRSDIMKNFEMTQSSILKYIV